MNITDYKIWDRDCSVEARTFKRVTGQLPEMESAKQLAQIISGIYQPGMDILDVGCAAGHYYNSLSRIDQNVKYFGVDATKEYISFAKKHFKNNSNVKFELADIYDLPVKFKSAFDIVFCCNVILHLPSLKVPLENLISTSKKYFLIRTLISDHTHLSKFLYSDTFDSSGQPIDFVYQNTYSRTFIRQIIENSGNYTIEFLPDKFDASTINSEFMGYRDSQSAVTRVENGVQLAGSKVFEWEWVKITK